MIRHKPKTRQCCRIHDLLHDFTIAEAKKEAEDYVSHVKSTPRLRTLLWFNPDWWLKRSVISFPIPELKLLRVIDLEGASLAVLPEQVGDLIHLRFLGLRGTNIRRCCRRERRGD
ncbi:unnamed protein product [Spirodela intermedia]|uniref:Uncharacterized protein n=1 Tax=Spirodela intermedia TaxID=51605 RepID=A0A7I8LDZ2_SPIIN|nr:unnamed protein product [Spirodela intermedia]